MYVPNQAKQKLLTFISILFVFFISTAMQPMYILKTNQESAYKYVKQPVQKTFDRNNIYDSLQLNSLGLTKAAFQEGISGLDFLTASGDIQNASIISIVDLSLPSSKKRLFVIDLNCCKLVFNTYVSHGRNSGKEMATKFSNKPNSNESSLGFYVTGNTYTGHHGYSLKLIGKEDGINSNAFARGIVMHCASYVSERVAAKSGCIGRSEGCPAIPEKLHKNIIEKIKNGTCLFLYSADKFYATHSKIRLSFIG